MYWYDSNRATCFVTISQDNLNSYKSQFCIFYCTDACIFISMIEITAQFLYIVFFIWSHITNKHFSKEIQKQIFKNRILIIIFGKHEFEATLLICWTTHDNLIIYVIKKNISTVYCLINPFTLGISLNWLLFFFFYISKL